MAGRFLRISNGRTMRRQAPIQSLDGVSEGERAMDKIPLEVLSARLENWERERRQLLALVVVAMTICLGLTVYGSVRGLRARSVDTENLVVRDRAGKVRAQLATTPGGQPCLSLFDSMGRDQIALCGTSDDTATLYLYDHGQVRMAMMTSTGTAAVRLYDRNHDSSTGLYMSTDSTTGLTFRNGSHQLDMGVQPDGHAGVRLSDAGGQDVTRLGSYAPLDPLAAPRQKLLPSRQLESTDVTPPASSAAEDGGSVQPALSSALDRRKFARPIQIE
jgi:hypothetical protein